MSFYNEGVSLQALAYGAAEPTVTNIGPCACCGCNCGCHFTSPYPDLVLTIHSTSSLPDEASYTGTIEVGDGVNCCYVCNFGLLGGVGACEVSASLCCAAATSTWVLTLSVSETCGAYQSHVSEGTVDCDLLDMDFTTYELYCVDTCGVSFYVGNATITRAVGMMAAKAATPAKPSKAPCGGCGKKLREV